MKLPLAKTRRVAWLRGSSSAAYSAFRSTKRSAPIPRSPFVSAEEPSLPCSDGYDMRRFRDGSVDGFQYPHYFDSQTPIGDRRLGLADRLQKCFTFETE